MKSSDEAHAIMANAQAASAAVRSLYGHAKALDPKVSLTYLCQRSGIRSKGYLSDIIRGRRTLNPRYAEPLARAFGLKGAAVRTLKVLAELESGELDAAAQAKAEERLAVLRRSMAVQREPLPTELAGMSFAFEVYCAFGLFRNAPSVADLLKYFGERHHEAVDAALALLLRHKLVEPDEAGYRATKSGVIFGASGSGFAHLDFLRASLRDAERNLKRWFPRRDEAYIESVILSVRRSEYLRLLPLLREQILETRSQLDVEDADTLVRFNFQIYPVDSTR